jgi:hypothetical protein
MQGSTPIEGNSARSEKSDTISKQFNYEINLELDDEQVVELEDMMKDLGESFAGDIQFMMAQKLLGVRNDPLCLIMDTVEKTTENLTQWFVDCFAVFNKGDKNTWEELMKQSAALAEDKMGQAPTYFLATLQHGLLSALSEDATMREVGPEMSKKKMNSETVVSTDPKISSHVLKLGVPVLGQPHVFSGRITVPEYVIQERNEVNLKELGIWIAQKNGMSFIDRRTFNKHLFHLFGRKDETTGIPIGGFMDPKPDLFDDMAINGKSDELYQNLMGSYLTTDEYGNAQAVSFNGAISEENLPTATVLEWFREAIENPAQRKMISSEMRRNVLESIRDFEIAKTRAYLLNAITGNTQGTHAVKSLVPNINPNASDLLTRDSDYFDGLIANARDQVPAYFADLVAQFPDNFTGYEQGLGTLINTVSRTTDAGGFVPLTAANDAALMEKLSGLDMLRDWTSSSRAAAKAVFARMIRNDTAHLSTAENWDRNVNSALMGLAVTISDSEDHKLYEAVAAASNGYDIDMSVQSKDDALTAIAASAEMGELINPFFVMAAYMSYEKHIAKTRLTFKGTEAAIEAAELASANTFIESFKKSYLSDLVSMFNVWIDDTAESDLAYAFATGTGICLLKDLESRNYSGEDFEMESFMGFPFTPSHWSDRVEHIKQASSFVEAGVLVWYMSLFITEEKWNMLDKVGLPNPYRMRIDCLNTQYNGMHSIATSAGVGVCGVTEVVTQKEAGNGNWHKFNKLQMKYLMMVLLDSSVIIHPFSALDGYKKMSKTIWFTKDSVDHPERNFDPMDLHSKEAFLLPGLANWGKEEEAGKISSLTGQHWYKSTYVKDNEVADNENMPHPFSGVLLSNFKDKFVEFRNSLTHPQQGKAVDPNEVSTLQGPLLSFKSGKEYMNKDKKIIRDWKDGLWPARFCASGTKDARTKVQGNATFSNRNVVSY